LSHIAAPPDPKTSLRVAFRGRSLLGRPLYNKDAAFTEEERDWFGLHGLLPTHVMPIEEQLALELEHVRRKADDLEKFIGLAALHDRNETLFFRLLAENLEEFMPIVYTPTVGRACQEYSHIFRRPRGVWITPADAGRIQEVLRNASQTEVRLIVATDNERILGLGDQGAGGMGIPVGKLALYSAGAGIYPAWTLPISLDVGTDNAALQADPFYLGWRHPRLRGVEYDAFIEAFVEGVKTVFPRAILQWEDFKQHNAIRILDRYVDRLPSFNDDIQGTASVVLAGILAGLRFLGRPLAGEKIVFLGAGAAAIGIARLVHSAQRESGVDATQIRRSTVLFDTKGLVYTSRPGIEDDKAALGLTDEDLAALGIAPDASPVDVVRAVRAGTLIGTTQTPGAFTEPMLREIAAVCPAPLVFPLSNPTSKTEATPEQVADWTDGRAMCATGSPFPPVRRGERTCLVGQDNNSFIFPGVGLGAIVAGARVIRDAEFLAAARTLAGLVRADRLECGALYPPVSELRAVSREIAIGVVTTIGTLDGQPLPPGDEGLARTTAAVDAAIWWPDYQDYEPA
jgi:malate dehydrogenase (oxaloacetate-decarboxylating)